MSFDLRKLRQAQSEGLLYFSANGKSPILWVKLAGLVHVVAYEKMRDRREPGIEVLDWRFQVDEAERTDDQAIFAGNVDRGCPRYERWSCTDCERGTGHLLQEIASRVHAV